MDNKELKLIFCLLLQRLALSEATPADVKDLILPDEWDQESMFFKYNL